ncbi:MAG: NAD(P)/FAD-dependent oxidoreductase [Bacteroidales bacterium]|nr:NAD(P)/FAD-dependent oxidoreductase [Bacteroidales bacterium]
MIQELQLRLLPEQAANEQSIKRFLQEDKGLDPHEVNHVRVLKRSIDARQRTIYVNLTVRVYVNEEPEDEAFQCTEYSNVDGCPQAIVVGAGPGGLFAALRLIERGIRPIVIERGKDVHERRRDVARIGREQIVDPESNYSFGEGGAGAFSDGKLYTRSKKRGSVEKVLNVFCQHGASTSILSDAHPHIGTDRLPSVIEQMRKTILRCGGEVHFQTRMTDLLVEGDKVVGIKTARESLLGPVILATGHSARDVYRWLYANGVEIEAKPLAVGVRLEHPADVIDRIQYHNKEGKGAYLPTAEYSFVTQADGRGVYSFCMCPGGTVVPAATGPEQVVVNGMSNAQRNSPWSNSGMVVETHVEDVQQLIGDGSPLVMMKFQEWLERLAWQQGGRRQTAPAQRMADFVNNRLSADLPRSSYTPGLVSSPLHFWMPDFVTQRLQQAFLHFGKTSHGFLTNEALMIGVETRTSSPVRILRDRDTLQHVRLQGLFPCGEGAGYAGGIVSAAIDGERCADMLAESMNN